MVTPYRALYTDKLASVSREKYKLKLPNDRRYPHFFEFLQASPSYELARLASIGKLEPTAPLPRDFDDVMKTFEAFGDTRQTEYAIWWLKRAQFQFGMQDEPAISVIMSAGLRVNLQSEEIQTGQSKLDRYCKVVRPDEGLPASVVLAIPLEGDRRNILKRVGEAIDQFHDAKAHEASSAPYKIIRDKTRKSTVVAAMRALNVRRILPRAHLFVIGNKSRLHRAYETDETQRRNVDTRDKRRNMEIAISRHLKRAYLFAENAARGKFPSLAALPSDPNRPLFEPQKLNRELKAMMRWMERRRQELEPLLQAERAKKAAHA